jgi:hypothetical protein
MCNYLANEKKNSLSRMALKVGSKGQGFDPKNLLFIVGSGMFSTKIIVS